MASAEALEADDASQLFGVLDERARNSIATMVKQRAAARSLIEADYPSSEKGPALAALGDAAQVSAPSELFARRCGRGCMATFADSVGPPASEVVVGDEVEVTTLRGRTLHMHAGKDGQYGLVWNHPALGEEALQASRELALIRDHAQIYRKQRALAQGTVVKPSE
ncbi:MAG: hypothetical protein RL701_1589 [Pseudomonadota bacterium]